MQGREPCVRALLTALNPADSHKYWAPVMEGAELESMTVPLTDVERRLKGVMDEHGVAVVTGVVPAHEICAMDGDFKADLDDLVNHDQLGDAPPAVRAAYERFQRDGPRAFPAATASQLTVSAGFALERGLPHGRLAWRVRKHANVHRVFRALHGTGDLVTSMDAIFFSPGGQAPAQTASFTAHVDQNMHDRRGDLASCDVYQGVLYVWESPADGSGSTTVVLPGSHRAVWPRMMADQKFRMNGEMGMHYSTIGGMRDREQKLQLAQGWAAGARRVPVAQGALFLWNSRTVHTGWRGGPRLAVPVCLEPRAARPEVERAARLRLAALGLPSTHWARVAMQHDLLLHGSASAGYFNDDVVAAAGGDGGADTAVLPLRGSNRPAGLRTDAAPEDVEQLRELISERIKFILSGVWKPEGRMPGCSELLDRVVCEDIKVLI